MSIVFSVFVFPGSNRKKLVWNSKKAMLYVYVQEKAEKNVANTKVCSFLAKTLGVPCSMVVIIQGWTSRKKTIRVQTSLTLDELCASRGIAWSEQQQCIV